MPLKPVSRYRISLLLCAVLFAGADGCSHLHPKTPPAQPTEADRDEAYTQVQLLTKAMMQIRKDYVDVDKIKYKDLTYGALKGMLESLDPYSQFMEPTAYEDMKDDTAGEYGGIGAVIGTQDGELTIIAPMEDSPGFRAGLIAGDRIMEIAGIATEGMSVNDAVDKIRGEKGTMVKVKIKRSDEQEPRVFEITRDIIRVASVKGAKIMDGGIGYIRITQFSDPTAAALDDAIGKLMKQGLKALVLDLRGNPGGLLTSSIAVSSEFLREGDLIVSTKGRGGVLNAPPAKAIGERHYTDFPMAILVNGGTASAAEIVSGAWRQDHKRAILVGERTFGKGSVQSVFQLDDGSALRLTTAKYYTPSERVIHGKGIDPDIKVEIPPAEWQKVQIKRAREENPELFSSQQKANSSAKAESLDNVTDRQLDRAADILKGILIFRAKD